jgi:DNA-binding transcriptional LysR family regulator
MELRDIEIFLTLAEELHFGRTAQRLHVTAARVSQSISKQERRIGAALFMRTSRKVTLTAVGQELFDDLLPHYRGMRESLERAGNAAQDKTEVLRLAILGSNLDDIRPVMDRFRSIRPACTLEITHNHFGDPFGPLRRGTVDLQITWLPVEEPDLTVGPIVFSEPIVLAVAPDHPLGGKESVCYEDLADYAVPGIAAPDYWTGSVAPFHTPSGRPIRRGPVVANFQELITAVAAGSAVCPVHDHANRYYGRPDVRYLPIVDAPLGHWAPVWRSAGETPLIRVFADVSEEIGPQGARTARNLA